MRKLNLVLLVAAAFTATACNRGGYQSNADYYVVDQTYVHRYGVEVPADDWASRGQDGQVISTLKNGVVVTKSYSTGTLDGETTYTFPHSETIEKVETYSQGKLVRDVIHNINGVPMLESIYQDNGKKVTSWYENGSPKSEENYEGDALVNGVFYTPNNQVDTRVENSEGIRNVRDDYGLIVSADTIKDGQLVSSTTYHPNGSPKAITPYVHGVIEGQKKTFLPAGEPDAIETWAAGKMDGITIIYQNGEKFAEVPYVRGIKQGIEKRYRDGSTVVEEISWINGQKTGPDRTYIGENVKTDWYYQDKPVSKANFDLMVKPAALR